MKIFDFKSGMVIYDEFSIDFDKPLVEQIYSLNEDIYLVKYMDKYLLDLGWYPEHNINGYFVVQIIYEEQWNKPIYYAKCRSKLDLFYEMNKAILYVEKLISI